MSNHRRHDESPTEFAERQERAEAEASRWFNDLAAEQIAIFNERMDVARAYKGAPKWDRVRDAAKREFERTTEAASHVAALVMADMMAAGEISEATSYAFDEAKVSHAMQQADDLPELNFRRVPRVSSAVRRAETAKRREAAPLNHAVFATAAEVAFHYHGKLPSFDEAMKVPALARALFDASKGGNVRGITEDHRFQLADVINAARQIQHNEHEWTRHYYFEGVALSRAVQQAAE